MILHNKIKKIINAIKNTDINEIEISSFWGAQKIRLTKNKNLTNVTIDNNKTENNVTEQLINIEDDTNNNDNITKDDLVDEKSTNEDVSNLTTATAPLVGTFYAASKEGEPPFINVGDTISVGQSICIIEAMKIFNEIESEFNGRIVEILISDGEPVEYGQALFTLKEE